MSGKKSGVLAVVLIIGVLMGSLFRGVNEPAHVNVVQADAPTSEFRGQLQFITKMYTEALGRAPTQAEWQDWVDYFQNPNNPCSPDTLKQIVRDFYTGGEFINLGYDRPAALLALFRGALNHEPDEEGFLYYRDDEDLSWEEVVTDFLDVRYDSEFKLLVTHQVGICKDAGEPPFYESASYGWDEILPKHPVQDIRLLAYEEPSRTQDELQEELNTAGQQNPPGTVELLPMEVITINGCPPDNKPLIIPEGVTLKTQGDPDPSHYAQMGRLVRVDTLTDTWPIVILQTGGTLSGVWVDGQRGTIGGNRRYESMNVLIQDDGDYPVSNPDITQTRFVENRLTDSIGGSLAQVQGVAEGWPCGNVYLGQNLLTAYANKHQGDFLGAQWTDGFAVPCAHTTVEDNEFVDISDVGVVLFRGGEGVVQSSVVRNNVMLNAGISAFGGFGADPFYPNPCNSENIQEYDFSGARIEDNLIWASPTTHIDAVLFAGTYAWEFEACPLHHNTGIGVTFSGNTTGDKNVCPSCTVRTNNPIMVSGMYSTNIGCNPLRVVIDHLTNCPRPGSGENLVLASIKEPHAWASFQPPIPLYTDKHIKHCMEHPEDPTPLPPQLRVVPCFWYFMPLTLKSFSVGGERSGPLPPPPEGGYPAPSPRPILPPTPAPPPDYPPPATPLSTPTPAPSP